MKSERFHFFDSLRAIAMILGIPLHACLAYGAIEYNWLLKDPSNSYLIDVGLDFLRLFRMPLFFVISGFLSALTIDKGSFLEKRTKRLIYPLIVFFIIFVVPLKSAWLALEVPDQLYSLNFSFIITHIKTNFFAVSSEQYFRHSPNWGHLWFLLYLFCFSLISIPIRKFVSFKFKNIYQLLIMSMLLTFGSYFLMQSHWVDQPFKIYPLPSLFCYYGSFYFFGWKLFSLKDFTLTKRSSLRLLIVGICLALYRSTLEVSSHLDLTRAIPNSWILNLMATLATWMLVIGIIYSFKNYFNKKSARINYFVDASYFIYLIHLPIIVTLQILLFRVDLHWLIKFPAVTILSLLFSVIIYHFLVKDRFIDQFLKGNTFKKKIL